MDIGKKNPKIELFPPLADLVLDKYIYIYIYIYIHSVRKINISSPADFLSWLSYKNRNGL